ncbi:Hypothetical protein NTJ_11465 [Nesidiocoris tenuis]|uniref:Serpin domain-containing protein n=1 Tax=Nesidiocoris tenuis TaxID=355587 RepID=A0ABN7B308_9HEMI|nr:Hypothetical protein NTJ_11465 [Nesidiocoris tenuis]
MDGSKIGGRARTRVSTGVSVDSIVLSPRRPAVMDGAELSGTDGVGVTLPIGKLTAFNPIPFLYAVVRKDDVFRLCRPRLDHRVAGFENSSRENF